MSPPLVKRTESGLLKLASPKCELLFDVFNGELGRVHLGRMLAGNDAGRLVILRKLSGAPGSELAAAIDLARSIAHPKLAKSIGVVRTEDAWLLAREYIPGVALCELIQALASQGEKVKPSVAVRIVLDLLSAAMAARELLPDASTSELTCLYAESAWIADFGESFLCEVPVSAILAQRARERGVEIEIEPVGAGASRDVHAAGLHLLELACGSSEPSALEDPALPLELRYIATRATGRHGTAIYPTEQAFADALLGLDPALIAADDEVSSELRRLMGPVLDTRRQKLAMTERVAVQEGAQDETKFFRAASVSVQRETARPPADLALSMPAPEPHSSKQRISPRSEPPEDPTTIFQRPDEEDSVQQLAAAESQAEEPAQRSQPVVAAPVKVQPAASDEPRPSLAQTSLEVQPSLEARSLSGRRLVLALVLLVALVAFGLTTDFSSARSNASSATQSSLHWLRSLAGKAARLLH